MIQQSRRGFLAGLGSAIAAPAIVRASSLMAIKPNRNWEFIGHTHNWQHRTAEEIQADFQSYLMTLLTQSGPVPYSDAGFSILRKLEQRFTQPVHTFTGTVVVK